MNSGRILPGKGIAFDSRSFPSSERKVRCCAFLGILRHILPHLLSIKWEYSIQRTTKSMGFAAPGKQTHALHGALQLRRATQGAEKYSMSVANGSQNRSQAVAHAQAGAVAHGVFGRGAGIILFGGINLASPPSVHQDHVIPQPTYKIFGLNTGVKLQCPGLIVGMSIPHKRQPETIPHRVRRRRSRDMVLLMINETHIRREGVSQMLGQARIFREC